MPTGSVIVVTVAYFSAAKQVLPKMIHWIYEMP